MRLLNANAAIAAGMLGSRKPERPRMVKIIKSLMLRIGGVLVRTLLFPYGSLSREAALVGAFSRGHRLGEVCNQCGADFFEPNLVCFHLLVWTDREGLHALKNTNQPVHIPVPQIEFSEGVHFHDSRFLSPTLRSGFRPYCSSIALRTRRVGLAVCRFLVRSRTIVEAQQKLGGRKADHFGQECDQEETCAEFLYCGGGSATGSGVGRAGNIGREASCAQNGK